MFGRKLRGAAATALLAMTGGLLAAVLPAGAALAAPPAAASPPVSVLTSSDATLSALSIGGDWFTPIAPAFAAATHDYQAFTADTTTGSIAATATDGDATVAVAVGGTPVVLTEGSGSVPLVRGRNDVTVTVTSEDTTATQVYRITVWRGVAPTSKILNITNPTSTILGGTRSTITLANGTMPDHCGQSVYIGAYSARLLSSTFDPATGLTRLAVQSPAAQGHVAGVADVKVTDWCNWGWNVDATSTDTGAFTFTDTYHVDSAEVPDPLTSGSHIVLHGTGVVSSADARYWLESPDGTVLQIWWWGWTGEDNATVYVEYPWGDEEYLNSGPRTLHVGYCPEGTWRISDSCTTVYTKAVNWQAPAPSDVSFSPRFGSTAGGNKVQLRGRFLVSGEPDLVVKMGNTTIPSWNVKYEADDGPGGDWSFSTYTQGYDVIEFEAPPSAVTGPVQVTASSQYGSTVARGTYYYAARPSISSIAPGTVANAGGAVITVQGSAFGTAGRPTVIINGVKSPFVTRISDTKLTAVVPNSTGTTGPVEVAVSSAQGGGVSDPASLTLAAPGAAPTVSAISPTSAAVGDEVTLTGTGFGAAGTVGVSVDGVWARVTGSTSTSVTFEVPATDTTGLKDLVVGTVTGTLTRSNALTVLPEAGIATVTPSTIPSYATGNAAKVVLDGAGFRSAGTVKVGTAAAVPYTSTNSGTRISGVAVPTGTAGSLPIVVTPTGSTTTLRSSVRVVAPKITYVGADPHDNANNDAAIDVWPGGALLGSSTAGGVRARIEGTGFGTAGVLKVGTTTVVTTSWSDTAITFATPAQSAGTPSVTVTPTGSTLAATRPAALRYAAPVALPTISRIASATDLEHGNRNEFHPVNDVDGEFTLTGTNLTGTSGAATRVIVSEGDSNPVTLTPSDLTATSLSFEAPRTFASGGWKRVTVVTDLGATYLSTGIYYLDAGTHLDVSPYYGLCLRTATPASGAVTYQPATIAVTNSGSMFGETGTVTFDGLDITPTGYGTGEVDLDLADLPSDLDNPWGWKEIVITPDDSSKPVQRVNFLCGVAPSVTTTVNGGTDPVTIAAGTSYTMGFQTSGLIGTNPFTVANPSGYEYVTASDFGATGFTTNVKAGLPVGAGDYYIRVALGRATYATERYLWFNAPSAVHLTITGTPVTITPVSNNGASFTYKGQLGDGTEGSPTDFHYTATSTADAISDVVWEYRNATCEGSGPSVGWVEGLPKDVALATASCGGDGTTQSSWDVRVKSFQMMVGGVDKSIYYDATKPTIQVTINPRNLTITAARADRAYDGTTVAPIGDLTVTGAVDGDDVQLAGGTHGDFDDPNAGVNKHVTLSGDLVLAGAARADYHLTNPQPTIVGTIAKADAELSLSASPSATLLSAGTPITITATVHDTRTGNPPDVSAGTSPVVLASADTSICTISGTTVTVRAAGSCVITGRQASSANYNAAHAASDPESTTEQVEITVFPAAQTISVVADDLSVPVGDTVEPTAQVTGLFEGDDVSGIDFDYYSGTTLLPGAPTDPGSYKVVPKGGTLTAANTAAYSNPTSFRYVAGSLVITPVPPTMSSMVPASGPTAGGTTVTIAGTRLDTVRQVRIGSVTLRAPDFTVNEDGTELTFRTPRVSSGQIATVTLVAGTASVDDVFTYVAPPPPPPPTGPVDLNLDLALKVDTKLVGAKARLSGGGLKPGSTFTLAMHSVTVVIVTGHADLHGNFSQLITLPGKACVRGGLHELVLTGTAPNGSVVSDSKWVVLDDKCVSHAVLAKRPTGLVLLQSFLFDRLSAKLTRTTTASLNQLIPSLRGAKLVTIIGYTQTQNTSPASVRANKALAQKRADTVARYLRAHGIRVRIVTVAKGPVDPVSRSRQDLNRRVVIEVKY